MLPTKLEAMPVCARPLLICLCASILTLPTASLPSLSPLHRSTILQLPSPPLPSSIRANTLNLRHLPPSCNLPQTSTILYRYEKYFKETKLVKTRTEWLLCVTASMRWVTTTFRPWSIWSWRRVAPVSCSTSATPWAPPCSTSCAARDQSTTARCAPCSV